jgi:hypothetical protein
MSEKHLVFAASPEVFFLDIPLYRTSPQPRLRRRRDILAHKPESRNSSYKWLRKTEQVTCRALCLKLLRICLSQLSEICGFQRMAGRCARHGTANWLQAGLFTPDQISSDKWLRKSSQLTHSSNLGHGSLMCRVAPMILI